MTIVAATALAMMWLVVLAAALGVIALLERRARLLPAAARAEAAFGRRVWGKEIDRPAAHYSLARILAFCARFVRGGHPVEGGSRRQLAASRLLSFIALMSGLSLIPLVSGWYATSSVVEQAEPVVLFDSSYGLALIVLFILVSGLSHTAAGLGEHNEWARLAAVRIAGCALSGVALLLLLFAPLVLAAGSLRFSEITLVQLDSFAPLAALAGFLPESAAPWLEWLRLPNWFIFRQPLTAVLAIPTLGLLLSRSLLLDGRGQSSGPAGYGLDADPAFLYQTRLEAGLAETFAAALFVALFLGGSGLPFVDAQIILAPAHAALGEFVPALFFFVFEVAVFAAKLILVIWGIQLFRRTTSSLRIDQSFEVVTRRLLPLAWANLILVAALRLAGALGTGAGQGTL